MIDIIASIIILFLEIVFLAVVLILNNIDEFLEWLDKKVNKR